MSRFRPGRWAALVAAAALATGLGVGVAGADQTLIGPYDDGPVRVPSAPTLKNQPPGSGDSPPTTGQLDLNDQGPSIDGEVGQFPPILERQSPQSDGTMDMPSERPADGSDQILRPGDRTLEAPRKRAGGGVGTGGEDPLTDCTVDDVVDPEKLDEDDYILEVIERDPNGQKTVDGVTYDAWFDKDTGCVLIAGEPDDPGDDTSESETPTSTPQSEPEEPTVIRGCTPTMWHQPGLPENARPTGELFMFQGGNYALFTDEAVGGEDCWLIPATDEGTTVEHACTVYRLFTVADGQVRIPYGATEVPCRHHEVVETRYELRAVPSGPVTRAGGDDAAVAAGQR